VPFVDIADQLYADLISPIEERMMGAVAGIVQDPDDAADAFQNALLYIWKNLKRIHRHPNPHGYILKVCISSAYDVLRRSARRRQREIHVPSAPDMVGQTAGSPDSTHNTLSAVRRGIATLPKKQAQAVLLRLLKDESFDAIGRTLGCTEVTARSHVSKGLARLRQHLSDLGLHPVEG